MMIKIDKALETGIQCGLIVMAGRPLILGDVHFQPENLFFNFFQGFIVAFLITKFSRKYRSRQSVSD